MTNHPPSDLRIAPLNTEVVGRDILVFDEIDSTNTYALEKGEDGSVIVADRQTAGRGRKGRTWHSAPGVGLWFSVALLGEPRGLTFAAALAVRDALAPFCAPKVKWPNDILIDGRKVCGILTEHRAGRTAVGIGINIFHQEKDFPEELRETAGSLNMQAPRPWLRGEILRDVLTHFDGKVMLLRSGSYDSVREEWAQACGLVGRRIRCGGDEGIVRALDTEGGIVLETAHGSQRVLSGEITIVDGE